MNFRALLSRSLAALLVAAPLLAPLGCGGESQVTEVADEPAIGPGAPPGGPPGKTAPAKAAAPSATPAKGAAAK